MNQRKHERNMARLQMKKEIAEMRREEWKIKREIIGLYIPFRLNIRFSKLIVLFCIVAIAIYTMAAIALQKYTMIEVSPTLTTCVYAFFGTELLSLAGIKMVGTKFTQTDNLSSVDSSAVG